MTVGELKVYLAFIPDDFEVAVEGGGGPEETFPVDVTSVRIRALDALGFKYDPKINPRSKPIPTCVIYG